MTFSSRLNLSLLITSLICLIVSVILSNWQCGNLYVDCPKAYGDAKHRTAVLGVVVLFTIGLVCISIALILEFISCCAANLRDQLAMNRVRLICLLLGISCILVALLVYTSMFVHSWSYFLATIGGVFAAQVAVLTLMTCQCVTVQREAVVHHRVAT